jgi:uncharacterized membrane protein HdeD (DUF308 family)
MESLSKKNWMLVLLKGLVLIFLAFLVLNNPVGALLGISTFIGIGFLITGVLSVTVSLAAKKEMKNWSWKLAEGILDIVFGFLLIANPEITAVVIAFVLGFWVVFYGILLTVGAFNSDKFNLINLIFGILIIFLGNFIMFNPIFTGLSLSIWIGISLLMAGIFNVVYSLDLKKQTGVVKEVV